MSVDAVPEAVREGPGESRSSRVRLIQAGTKLFREHGYRRVSLDRILRDSGVCRSNFYYHFRGKQDLALAVVDEWWTDFRERVLRPVLDDPRLGPLAKARAVVDEMIARLEGNPQGGCPFGTLANAEASFSDVIRARLVEVFDAMAEFFEDRYAEAAARGELRMEVPCAAELAASTLAFIQGGYVLSKTYVDAWRMRFAAQSWFDLIERGSGSGAATGRAAATLRAAPRRRAADEPVPGPRLPF